MTDERSAPQFVIASAHNLKAALSSTREAIQFIELASGLA